MDYLLRSLLRKYQVTKDPLLAIEFTEASARLFSNPNLHTERFFEAWWWLHNHPAFYFKGPSIQATPGADKEPGFFRALDFSVQKVNPTTLRVEDDQTGNTHVRFWLEVGPWEAPTEEELENDTYWGDDWEGTPTHDYELDCGGDTYEEAIIKMAEKVREKYGDYSSE